MVDVARIVCGKCIKLSKRIELVHNVCRTNQSLPPYSSGERFKIANAAALCSSYRVGVHARGLGEGMNVRSVREEEREQETYGSERVGASADRGDYLVMRGDHVREILGHMNAEGIVFLCAPDGFGKTSLLVQCAAVLRDNPSVGDIDLRDGSGLDPEGLCRVLDDCAVRLKPLPAPYVLLDGLPALGKVQVQAVPNRLRSMRDEGMKIAIACTPSSGNLIRAIGDSAKCGAPFLFVRPREYAAWAKVYNIAPTVDVYGLTRGIPALVAAVRGRADRREELGELERAVIDLYRTTLSVLEERKDPLAVLLSFMIMLGRGSLQEFERCGMSVNVELLARLQREYPVVNYDAERREFRCLGTEKGVLSLIRREIVTKNRQFGMKSVRVLMKSKRVDAAVSLMEHVCDVPECIQVLSQFPVLFSMHGHARFVRSVISKMDGEQLARMDVAVALAGWLAGLFTGEYRLARAMASELRQRANEIGSSIDYEDWLVAVRASGMWTDCKAVHLPEVMDVYKQDGLVYEAEVLSRHLTRIEGVLCESEAKARVPFCDARRDEDEVVVASIIEFLDKVLLGALCTGEGEGMDADERLNDIVQKLTARGMAALAVRTRAVASINRLMNGRPIVDERAFSDASRVAVRESNLDGQLFMLLLEGWQFLMLGQYLNAGFRAQQVQKLADGSRTYLVGWAEVLERISKLRTDARLTIREEAEQYDLGCDAKTASKAWAVALHLSVARFDADLAAWFSINRELLLSDAFVMRARLALYALGDRVESIRRLLPQSLSARYELEDGLPKVAPSGCRSTELKECMAEADLVCINLFGGFHVTQDGHTLTADIWKRRKASILTARLALAGQGFVSKTVLTNELWPGVEPRKARQSLYVNMTAMRRAFGQSDRGPQYVVTQADGVGLNTEHVQTDLMRFDALAKEILIKRTGVSLRQVVDACLRLEEVYKGPLFVPDCGDTRYFVRMRRAYQSKFIDCMVRGIDAAIEENDLLSASWLSNAAIRQEPTREDVIRRAMTVMDREGRRREIVELYQSHLHYVRQELHAQPERETQELYAKIIKENEDRVLI